MELIRRSERIRNSGEVITRSVRAIGGKIEHLGIYTKWIEVALGRALDRMALYEVTMPDGKHGWTLIDCLGQLACPVIPDENEVVSFLKDEGWERKVEQDDDDEEEMEE